MSDALSKYISKIERRNPLPEASKEAFLSLPGVYQEYASGDEVVHENQPATHCCVIETGFVSRVRSVAQNTRQIVGFNLPGDAVDLQCLLFSAADHTIMAHAPTRVFWVAHDDLWALADRDRILGKALWLDTLVDASIFREWTANLGQRRAKQRIAHLVLELAERFKAIGLANNDTFPCPLTQTALSQALGLSLVHLNKSLQSLRQAGFLSTKHSIKIENRAGLESLCNFDPSYLHISGSRISVPVLGAGNDAYNITTSGSSAGSSDI